MSYDNELGLCSYSSHRRMGRTDYWTWQYEWSQPAPGLFTLCLT